jgi:uncharacterized protein YdhG (YjbR/CyaY superfamily)
MNTSKHSGQCSKYSGKNEGDIRKAAPEAEEAISYQIPTFKLNGNLVFFAAFKNHMGLSPQEIRL